MFIGNLLTMFLFAPWPRSIKYHWQIWPLCYVIYSVFATLFMVLGIYACPNHCSLLSLHTLMLNLYEGKVNACGKRCSNKELFMSDKIQPNNYTCSFSGFLVDNGSGKWCFLVLCINATINACIYLQATYETKLLQPFAPSFSSFKHLCDTHITS